MPISNCKINNIVLEIILYVLFSTRVYAHILTHANSTSDDLNTNTQPFTLRMKRSSSMRCEYDFYWTIGYRVLYWIDPTAKDIQCLQTVLRQ